MPGTARRLEDQQRALTYDPAHGNYQGSGMQGLDVMVTHMTIAFAVWEGIAFMFAMAVLYFVLKLAIRDGIRESGLLDQRPPTSRASADKYRVDAPDMRAER